MNPISDVSTAISQFNVENAVHHAPNALAAAQSNLQSQEIIKEGIKVAQSVQATEASEKAQRVHRKSEQERRNNNQQGDSYEHSKNKNEKDNNNNVKNNLAPLIHEQEIKISNRNFNFTA